MAGKVITVPDSELGERIGRLSDDDMIRLCLSSPGATTPDGEDLMSATTRTVDHSFVGLTSGHDPGAVDGFIAEGYINHDAHVKNGREANRAFWNICFAAFPNTEVTLDDVLVDGDRVAGRFTYTATFAGPFLGLPPNGERVVMHSIKIWRVEDDRAIEHWDQLETRTRSSPNGPLPETYLVEINDEFRSTTVTVAQQRRERDRETARQVIVAAAGDLGRTEGWCWQSSATASADYATRWPSPRARKPGPR